ncbi:hypothetical protein LSUE1_G005369 [Lachnellula suecica]|uniref:Rhodopsin domain-containing protein n=1 Tax=Lachnellula suecica TaxID=602035 RepID=A0A8T9C0N3_9HELO|nr:hypothetical protein LSUE1_G005369 [Lachnellula suecica]
MENTIDIHNTPATQAPPGYTSNLVNPETQQPGLVAAAVVCLSLTTVLVGIDFLQRHTSYARVRIEDYTMVIAQLGFAAFAGVIVTSGTLGQGRHLWDVSIAVAMQVSIFSNISEILYGPTMFCAKFSVLKQMERIFCSARKDHIYWWIQAMIWANALFDLSIFVAFLCACVPREKLWNPLLPGTCISTNGSIIATSVINIISDWAALILPLIVIRKLQMNGNKKIGVMAIFAVGFLACADSIIRLLYSIRLTQTFDLTWAVDFGERF